MNDKYLDLTLIIYQYKLDGEVLENISGYNRIVLERDIYDVFAQINSRHNWPYNSTTKAVCNPHPFVGEVRWYGKNGIENIRRDAYGEQLTFLSAGELTKVDASGSNYWNQAVFEMIKMFPPYITIILYWC